MDEINGVELATCDESMNYPPSGAAHAWNDCDGSSVTKIQERACFGSHELVSASLLGPDYVVVRLTLEGPISML